MQLILQKSHSSENTDEVGHYNFCMNTQHAEKFINALFSIPQAPRRGKEKKKKELTEREDKEDMNLAKSVEDPVIDGGG
jgi:hypothetical protein